MSGSLAQVEWSHTARQGVKGAHHAIQERVCSIIGWKGGISEEWVRLGCGKIARVKVEDVWTVVWIANLCLYCFTGSALTTCCILRGIVNTDGLAQPKLELVRCVRRVQDIDLVRDGLVRKVPGRTIVDDSKGHVDCDHAKDLVLRVTIRGNPGADLCLFFGRQFQVGSATALYGTNFGLN
jgi:hypothetical protein